MKQMGKHVTTVERHLMIKAEVTYTPGQDSRTQVPKTSITRCMLDLGAIIAYVGNTKLFCSEKERYWAPVSF